LFAKLREFFDDLLFFDAGACEQTFKSGGCGAQGMEIGFQNWFTFGGNVKADGLAMPGYGDGVLALQQRRHALTKFPYSYFGRGHICGLVCFMCTHYNTTAAHLFLHRVPSTSTDTLRLVIARNRREKWESLILRTSIANHLGNFRHALATALVKLKVDPKTVQGMLRHEDFGTTMQLYAQSDMESMREAQGKFLEQLLGDRIHLLTERVQ
jgi:hypothetical protein